MCSLCKALHAAQFCSEEALEVDNLGAIRTIGRATATNSASSKFTPLRCVNFGRVAQTVVGNEPVEFLTLVFETSDRTRAR